MKNPLRFKGHDRKAIKKEGLKPLPLSLFKIDNPKPPDEYYSNKKNICHKLNLNLIQPSKNP